MSIRTFRYHLLFCVYLGVAGVLVCPNRQTLHNSLPVEDETLGAVALFNVWTIWWNADRALHGFQNYWNAPIFYPEKSTFAYSEPQPATLLVAPVIWMTGSRILAYKIYLLFAFTLNAFTTAVILKRKTSFWFAATGGMAMLFLPAVHASIGVLQLVPVWGVLWAWDACRRMTLNPSVLRGLELGAAFGCVWLTCMHHGLFFTLLLMICGWLLLHTCFQKKFILAILAAMFVSLFLAGPLIYKVKTTLKGEDYERSKGVVTSLSVLPIHYAYSSSRGALPLFKAPARSRKLSPGWIKLLLLSCCLAICVWRKKYDHWILFLLFTGIAAFVLSLGPNLKIGTWEPWWTLVEWVPGFAQVRSVYRFSYFLQMTVVLLAMLGAHNLWLLQKRFVHRLWKRRATQWLMFGLCVGAVLESIPTRSMQAGVPNAATHQQWIEFIKQQTPGGKSIACYPFSTGPLVEDFDVTARWMYYGTFHGKPLVNGYSGFFPKSYHDLKKSVNSKFPSEEVLRAFQDQHVEFLVIQQTSLSPETVTAANTKDLGIHLVLHDPVGIDVYQLRSSK